MYIIFIHTYNYLNLFVKVILTLFCRYTYGKPVKGKAVLKLRFGYTYVSYDTTDGTESKYVSQEFNVSLIVFSQSFSLSSWFSALVFKSFEISLAFKNKTIKKLF